jgi:hypothetical protein
VLGDGLNFPNFPNFWGVRAAGKFAAAAAERLSTYCLTD